MKRICTDPAILAIFEEVRRRAQELFPQYFEGCKLSFFINDSTREIGICKKKYSRPTDVSQPKQYEAEICLSQYQHDLDDIRTTLVHEFGHFVTHSKYHSKEWKARTDEIGKKWNIICQCTANPEQSKKFRANIPAPKYVFVCEKCGQVIRRYKRSAFVSHPDKYTCGKCGGKFKPLSSGNQQE